MRLCLRGQGGKVAVLVVIAAVLAPLFLCHENTRERRGKENDLCTRSSATPFPAIQCERNKMDTTCEQFIRPTTTVATATSQLTTTPTDEEIDEELDHVLDVITNADDEKKMGEIAKFFSDSSRLLIKQLLNEKDPVKRKSTALKVQNTSLEITDITLNSLKSLSAKNRTSLLSNILDTFESLGPILATILDAGEARRIEKPNLEMITKNVDLSSSQNEVPFTFKTNAFSFLQKSLKLFANGSDAIAISSLVFKKMGNFLLNRLGDGDRRVKKAEQLVINTDMLMISMGSTEHVSFSEHFSMTLKMTRQTGLRNPQCYSLHSGDSAPTKEGCTGRQLNATHVQCTCNHLTSYSVLMSVERSSATKQDAVLDVLTKIALAVSVFFLILAFLTFVSFLNLSSERNTIHTHLTVSLALAQLLYLFGIDQVDNKMACAVVAGILHFLFLAAFCWMAVEGLEVYLKLITVFSFQRSMLPFFLAAGYGIPAIIVAVSAAVNKQGYGTAKVCWLSTDKWFHFSFIGPVLAIVLWNAVMLTVAIVIMRRHMRSPSKKGMTKIQQMKNQLKGVVALLCVMGVTWLFGIFAFGETASMVFGYVFVLMNGTQGVFIFFFHCYTNEKVLKEYRRRLRNARFIPEGLRRLGFLLIKTESIQDFGKSTERSTPYKGTLSQFQRESQYKTSVVVPPSPPPAPKARSPYSDGTGIKTTLSIPGQIAKKQKSSQNTQNSSPEGDSSTAVPNLEEPATPDKDEFLTKDLVVPESTENMVIESGVYLGEPVSKITDAGEDKTASDKNETISSAKEN